MSVRYRCRDADEGGFSPKVVEARDAGEAAESYASTMYNSGDPFEELTVRVQGLDEHGGDVGKEVEFHIDVEWDPTFSATENVTP